MEVHRSVDKISWISHPTASGVDIKPLISKKEDSLNVTCMLVSVPAGIEVPEHIHENQDDILYPLKGKGTMWIEEEKTFSLKPGVIVRVPKGTKHKIFEVTEDLLIYDVFCPALM